MSGYIECPNCVQDRIIVPLRKEGNSKICPLCESIYKPKFSTQTKFGNKS